MWCNFFTAETMNTTAKNSISKNGLAGAQNAAARAKRRTGAPVPSLQVLRLFFALRLPTRQAALHGSKPAAEVLSAG